MGGINFMYETETQYSREEYKKLENILYVRNLRVVLVVAIVGFLIFFSRDNYSRIIYTIFCAILIIINTLDWCIQIRRIKKSYGLTESVTKKYIFYEDKFEEDDGTEKKYMYYYNIKRVIETKTDMYISLEHYKNSQYHGYYRDNNYNWYTHHIIIKKENTSDELLNLIRKYK